jgi:ribosomal protein S27AE
MICLMCGGDTFTKEDDRLKCVHCGYVLPES